MRRLWRLHEGPIRYDGRFYHINIYPAVELRPLRNNIPIYLAGTNPRMIEAAGAVADGLVGHPVFTPEYVAEVARPALARGAERTGRSPKVPIAGYVVCAIADNADQARREAAAQLAFYACVKTFDAVLIRQHGFQREAETIRDAFKRHDMAAMVAGVSDRMLDTLSIYGTAAEARQRFFERYADVYEQPLLFSPSVGMHRDRQWENIQAIVESFRPATIRIGAHTSAMAESRPRR
jgi:alkanesulfonate monooxygenase SsuD/methylene tetrahydromethanopterin reductase-like flavin-dependent oxidoreductase (luciferase family)